MILANLAVYSINNSSMITCLMAHISLEVHRLFTSIISNSMLLIDKYITWLAGTSSTSMVLPAMAHRVAMEAQTLSSSMTARQEQGCLRCLKVFVNQLYNNVEHAQYACSDFKAGYSQYKGMLCKKRKTPTNTLNKPFTFLYRWLQFFWSSPTTLWCYII